MSCRISIINKYNSCKCTQNICYRKWSNQGEGEKPRSSEQERKNRKYTNPIKIFDESVVSDVNNVMTAFKPQLKIIFLIECLLVWSVKHLFCGFYHYFQVFLISIRLSKVKVANKYEIPQQWNSNNYFFPQRKTKIISKF